MERTVWDARVVILPIRGHARHAGHPRFGNSRAHLLRPVNHPDRRSGAECRFRRRVYGNRDSPVLPEQPATALNDGSIEALAEGTAMWSDTKTTAG
jgi:hypothetical protein